MDRNDDVLNFFQKTFILKRPGVAIFADIIKIVTMCIKTILKDSRKVRRIRNYVSKWNLYLNILIQQNLLISGKKNADLNRTQEVCHVIYIDFGSYLVEL